jgi:adenylyl cyclase-associated protein
LYIEWNTCVFLGALRFHSMANTSKYRLEAATSRLEDMAMGLDEHNAQKAPDSAAALEPEPSKQPTPTAPAAPAPAPLPPQIEDFDKLIEKDVKPFVELGRKIGGLVEEQV